MNIAATVLLQYCYNASCPLKHTWSEEKKKRKTQLWIQQKTLNPNGHNNNNNNNF